MDVWRIKATHRFASSKQWKKSLISMDTHEKPRRKHNSLSRDLILNKTNSEELITRLSFKACTVLQTSGSKCNNKSSTVHLKANKNLKKRYDSERHVYLMKTKYGGGFWYCLNNTVLDFLMVKPSKQSKS